MKKGEDKRFRKISSENLGLAVGNALILQDTQTGVCYLFVQSGYAGGLTPLLDREGKPIIMSTLSVEE